MVSLDEHLKKNHPKKPYNEKDDFSKTKIEPKIYHLNNAHHTPLVFKYGEFLIIGTFVIFKLHFFKIQGNIFKLGNYFITILHIMQHSIHCFCSTFAQKRKVLSMKLQCTQSCSNIVLK
jgi:hypothetical protein